MNKASLTSAINTFITAIITQTKVRNAYLELINVFFQTTTNQSLSTGSNVFWHNLYYKKQGNIVSVNGFITNKFTVAKSGLNIITIPNSLYYAKTSQDTVCFAFTDATGSPVQISFSADKIYLIGNLSPNQKIYINAHYQTND